MALWARRYEHSDVSAGVSLLYSQALKALFRMDSAGLRCMKRLSCWCAAFDKGDLLYLRDEEEKKRFKEEELRESERLQFLRMQASTGIPKEVPMSLPPKPPNPDNPPQK